MRPPIQDLTTYLIDLDGVIYRGNELINGAKEFVGWLEENHKKYLFLTNNSFASEADVTAKLLRLGIQTNQTHVLGAAQAAVQIIAQRKPAAAVYVIGEEPLFTMVSGQGLQIINPNWQEADVVLVGLDRTCTYQRITEAVLAIRKGAQFIAINRDPILPIAGGKITAGTGALVAAIEASSETHPEVIGKPEPDLLFQAMRLLESNADETVMIGDNLVTDIKAGIAAGTHTLLVLSGKDTPTSLQKSSIQPDYVYDDVGKVLDDIYGHK